MTDAIVPFSLSDPGSLVSLVPHLLGFVPEDSLIVVWLHEGRVGLTMRVDLSAPRATVQHHVRQQLVRRPWTDAVVLTWSSNMLRARRVARWCRAVLPAALVAEQLHCDGEQWWSLTCDDPGCCSPHGTPLRTDTEAVAWAVLAGMGKAASREEAVAVVAGPAEADLPRLRELEEEAVDRATTLEREELADLLMGLVAELESTGELPDEAGCVELGVLATLGIGAASSAASLADVGAADFHLRLWSRVVAVTPPEAARGPLAVLGVVAWVAGQGAIATECCCRLEELWPEHVLVELLRAATSGVLAPSEWSSLRGLFQAPPEEAVG